MSLYPITSGLVPQASDVQQLNNIFNGSHDIGQVNLAPVVTAPTTTGFSFATQSGGSLGVGNYQYVFTYVTGQYKTDGITLQITGETLASSSLSVTTTSTNKSVKVTLPNPGPVSIVATRIYRTAVGGSTYGLIATVKDGVTSYTDTTADGSRGAAPPTTNTTGTILTMPGQPASIAAILGQNSLAANVETILTYGVTGMNGSGVFYAPYKGVYLFNASLYTNINGTGASCILRYYKNGSLVNTIAKTVNAGSGIIETVLVGTALVGMNANDQIYFSALNSSGGNLSPADCVLSYVKVT